MIWTIIVGLVIVSIMLGATITAKLISVAHSPQSTSPKGQTLFQYLREGR